MITIITKTNTIFINEKETTRVEYDRMNGVCKVYYPGKPNVGLLQTMIDYQNVTSVGFTSEAQPTSLVFNSKGNKHDGT